MRFINKAKLRAEMLPAALVHPHADALRRFFDEAGLRALESSISACGMTEPVSVVKDKLGYAVVSGERRLMAAKALGLKRIPAVILEEKGELAFLLAAVLDNGQREPLSCFEQARAYKRLLALTGKTPQELAPMLGAEPETIVSRLRLLTLDDEASVVCEAANLPEKLIDRLIALPHSERAKLFFGLLNEGVDLGERARTLRERLHVDSDEAPLRTVAIKDVRIFFNTIDRAIDVMKQAGVEATSERHDYDGFIEYFIRIPSRDALARR